VTRGERDVVWTVPVHSEDELLELVPE
jgi:hypothetical protein